MMMAEQLTWGGTQDEWRELVAAVEAHCTCDKDHPEHVQCSAHKMLRDQTTLNRLHFGLILHDTLEDEEWRKLTSG